MFMESQPQAAGRCASARGGGCVRIVGGWYADSRRVEGELASYWVRSSAAATKLLLALLLRSLLLYCCKGEGGEGGGGRFILIIYVQAVRCW
jgi:hypothetical protein